MRLAIRLTACAAWLFGAAAAGAGLTVFPSRLVLDAAPRTAELRVTNPGATAAIFDLTLEARRMTEAGRIEPIAMPDARETQALAMLSVAPERLTLPPGGSATVTVVVRAPPALAHGEYRAHLLLRPVAGVSIATAAQFSGAITPVVSTALPIVVRYGIPPAQLAIAEGRVMRDGDATRLDFDLIRAGEASAYGDLRVTTEAGEMLAARRGVAVYPEIGRRRIRLKLATAPTGPVTVAWIAPGGATLATARIP